MATGIVIVIVAGLVLMWLAMIAVLWATKGRFDLAGLREALRLLPDLIRPWIRPAGLRAAAAS
jgi:nitrogen fixation-related uncharacterized protein